MDMPERQSEGLLRLLYEHMTSPQFLVRYHWRPDTLAFWDNRATMHFGIFDYEGERRVMHRVTLRATSRRDPVPRRLAASRSPSVPGQELTSSVSVYGPKLNVEVPERCGDHAGRRSGQRLRRS